MTPAESTRDGRRRRPIVRVIRRSLLGLVTLLILAVVAFLIWANTGIMHAQPGPLELVRADPAVSIVDAGNAVVMTPTGPASGTGLVFIPGAKVDANAYLYKLSGAVEKDGLTVVITKPILHLAFFDQRALTDFTEDASGNVTTWYVGGHSLGGVRACQYAQHPSEQHPKVQGLILFGSYCANDLSQTNLEVLSLSGGNDRLSTPRKVRDAACSSWHRCFEIANRDADILEFDCHALHPTAITAPPLGASCAGSGAQRRPSSRSGGRRRDPHPCHR